MNLLEEKREVLWVQGQSESKRRERKGGKRTASSETEGSTVASWMLWFFLLAESFLLPEPFVVPLFSAMLARQCHVYTEQERMSRALQAEKL